MYINGASVGTTSLSNTDPGTGVENGINVGYDVIGVFTGVIADVRIYDRVLPEKIFHEMWNPRTRWDLYRPLVWPSRVPNMVPPRFMRDYEQALGALAYG